MYALWPRHVPCLQSLWHGRHDAATEFLQPRVRQAEMLHAGQTQRSLQRAALGCSRVAYITHAIYTLFSPANCTISRYHCLRTNTDRPILKCTPQVYTDRVIHLEHRQVRSTPPGCFCKPFDAVMQCAACAHCAACALALQVAAASVYIALYPKYAMFPSCFQGMFPAHG